MIKLFYPQSAHLVHATSRSRTLATYDEGSDSSDGGDGLARAVVQLDLDEVLLGLPGLSSNFKSEVESTYVSEADSQVTERLGQFALLSCERVFVSLGAVGLHEDLWHRWSIIYRNIGERFRTHPQRPHFGS
jgi:hypothetical protein